MRIIIALLMTSLFTGLSAQTDEELIRQEVKNFSASLMAGENDKVVAAYTSDSKIFPNDLQILSGNDLKEYWNPSNPGNWKTTYHKVTPVEIKVIGNEAYDYGYYEGSSTNGEQTSNWKGKYVIVWRKENGKWKIYLDIWNNIRE